MHVQLEDVLACDCSRVGEVENKGLGVEDVGRGTAWWGFWMEKRAHGGVSRFGGLRVWTESVVDLR